ncbi:MAG: GntR family transcriptional regulator [Clostridia bacterium]|nr:GntR family transcriptional regulator [Clostridia bacterium]
MSQIRAARSDTPDRIEEQLRKDIIIGKYRKGDKIVETELAEVFGASRGSVRTALAALEGEGMIHMLPNGRKEVVGFSKKEARDMYELRWTIENRAVEIAWENKTMNFTPLLEMLKEIEQCAQEQSGDTNWYDLDIRFHHALVQVADSAPLLKAWEITMPTMYALLEFNTSIDYKAQYIEEFLFKHKMISEMIITGDERIYDVLKEHITTANEISDRVMEHFNP